MMSRRPSTRVVPCAFSICSVGTTSPFKPSGLVHHEEIGAEAQRRLPDDGGAHFHRLIEIDVEAQRLVFAVGELDHARDPHEVDPRAEIEAADDGRSGQDEDRYALEPIDDRVRDGPATTQVAEAEAVVAVDQDPCVVESFHVILWPA